MAWKLATGGTLASENLEFPEEFWVMIDMLLAAGGDVSGKVKSGLVMYVLTCLHF